MASDCIKIRCTDEQRAFLESATGGGGLSPFVLAAGLREAAKIRRKLDLPAEIPESRGRGRPRKNVSE